MLATRVSLSPSIPAALPASLSFPLVNNLRARSPLSLPPIPLSARLPLCEVPFPARRSGKYRKGMIPARPLYQGVGGSVWDPEPSNERVGDWGGPATVWSLLCVAETRATRPNGEWGYSTRRHMLGHECPGAVSPARGVVPTDLQSSI